MTIDDGSSLSQSETHLDIFNRVVRSRMAMIASMVNWQLLPKLQEMGLPFTDDDVFVWDEEIQHRDYGRETAGCGVVRNG